MAILEAMKKLKAAGLPLDRTVVELLSGNAKTPQGYKKKLSEMKNKNLGVISYGSGSILDFTQLGMDAVGYDPDATPASNEDFHEKIKQILPNKQALQIFEALLDGQVHDKQQIAIQVLNLDPTKLSGYDKNLSKLSTMRYLTKTETTIVLTDKCFPCGRPEN